MRLKLSHMNYFFDEKDSRKPLTLREKLPIWAMLYVLVPAFAFFYSVYETKNEQYAEIERIHSQPVEIALPKELPEDINEF